MFIHVLVIEFCWECGWAQIEVETRTGRRRGRGAPAAAGDAAALPSYSKLFITRRCFIPQQSFVSNKRKLF